MLTWIDYDFVDHHIEILNHHRDYSRRPFTKAQSRKTVRNVFQRENWKGNLAMRNSSHILLGVTKDSTSRSNLEYFHIIRKLDRDYRILSLHL